MTPTMTTPSDPALAVQVIPILERTVCLVLHCTGMGNNRSIDPRAIAKTDQPVDDVAATKQLFRSKDLQPCWRVQESVKAQLRALSVDGGTRVFGPSTYMLPLLAVGRAEAVLAAGVTALTEQAAALAEALPALLAARAEKLGPLYHAGDYPSPDEVKRKWRIRWNYVSFGAPDKLEEVDAAAYARAEADWNDRLASAYDDVIVGLRAAALRVMRDLAARLCDDADGKPKVLQPTALRDLQTFLGNLPVLNSVGKDDALADVLARVGAVAQGVDVETLRKAPAIRGLLLEAATTAASSLDRLVSTAGRRALDLD